MWSRVSLWVMAPGRADRLDARAGWVFRVADAQSAPFSWKGVDYTTGLLASAPAYVDFELPPGIYVAWADLGALTTHRAALAVHDEPSLVVRLLPDVVDDVPLPEGECRITIDEVRGEDVRNGWPGTIVVSGTASSCPIVHVVIQREEAGGYEAADATVAGDGSWTQAFPNQFKAECGTPMEVVTTCTADPTCQAKAVLPVHCD
jgi:hypothetical protein